MDYEIVIPETDPNLDQHEEWIILKRGQDQERIRLHDYDEIYKIPGLYEEIFYDKLKCDSPTVLCNLLEEARGGLAGCRVLDFGGGNGMVAEEVMKRGGEMAVGIDIIEEAKEAAERDRPGVYEDYYVSDLSHMPKEDTKVLKHHRFNTLVTVAALGFEDIPPTAFLNAFNLIEDGGWVAFNIKDRFLSEEDETGYSDLVSGISGDHMTIRSKRRYCHRLSISGEELYYIAIVGKKIKDISLKDVEI